MRADHVTLARIGQGADHRSAGLRVGRAPGNRQTLLAIAGMGGQHDVLGRPLGLAHLDSILSGLGKGVVTASIGLLLKAQGYRVSLQKIDPYVNVDAGTMNPYEHGEVFVTRDGKETDLDIGRYERFLDESLTAAHYFTTGQVYLSVIERERAGGYLGQQIPVLSHVFG